jgi:hypothetical protein
METVTTTTWIDYLEAIASIRKKYNRYVFESDDIRIDRKIRLLFRGQSSSCWGLTTTLERATDEEITVARYSQILQEIVPEFESYTGTDWQFPDHDALHDELKSERPFVVNPPGYPFWVYLRHVGFPSPLLDWTTSPFVAAYFALIGAREGDSAVYCYIDVVEAGKSTWENEAQIHVMFPYVKTHKRHFAQKAWYTIATEWIKESGQHAFCCHEDIFEIDRENQDLLFKLILPQGLRKEGLEQLEDYNVNDFTLFGSEESLATTLATRKFDFEGWDANIFLKTENDD